MKNIKYIIAVLVVVVFAIVILKGPKPESNPPVSDVDLSPGVDSRQLCYIWNTEAGDKAMLSMDLRGSNVIGELYLLPAEKDSKVGIFKGTVTAVDKTTMARTVHAIWEAKGEGMTVNEELSIMFGEGMASPGFGAMKDRGDGVYVYADPANISYSLPLSQTDCGDEAMN